MRTSAKGMTRGRAAGHLDLGGEQTPRSCNVPEPGMAAWRNRPSGRSAADLDEDAGRVVGQVQAEGRDHQIGRLRLQRNHFSGASMKASSEVA